jgi:non-ribosomal peptide synthetase component F
VVIGSPAAGRERRESESLIGVFLNGLPVRIGLAGAATFRELLRQVRQRCLDAYADQEYSFERLVELLGLVREPSHMAVFQVVLNMLNLPTPGGELPGGIRVEPLPGERIQSKYDLMLYGLEREDGLLLRLEYATDLFDRPRMEDLLGEVKALLERVAEEPDAPAGARGGAAAVSA